MPGREPEYTPELAMTICEHLAEGMSLNRVCNEIQGMPRYRTVRRWELTNKEFAQQLRTAREIGCHIMAEQCLEIADSVQSYSETTQDADGKFITKHYDNIAQSRIRIDTRLRLLGKWLPMVYGDKVDVTHAGAVKVDTITRRIIWPGQPGVVPPVGLPPAPEPEPDAG